MEITSPAKVGSLAHIVACPPASYMGATPQKTVLGWLPNVELRTSLVEHNLKKQGGCHACRAIRRGRQYFATRRKSSTTCIQQQIPTDSRRPVCVPSATGSGDARFTESASHSVLRTRRLFFVKPAPPSYFHEHLNGPGGWVYKSVI